MCVVGPTVHVGNLGLRPEVTFFVLFCLPFLLYLWKQMTQMPRAGALILKLKPVPFCAPPFPFLLLAWWGLGVEWPRGWTVLQMEELGQLLWGSCCASPLFSNNHENSISKFLSLTISQGAYERCQKRGLFSNGPVLAAGGPWSSCLQRCFLQQSRGWWPGQTAVPTWTEGTALGKWKGRLRSWGRQLALLSSTLPLEHSQASPGGGAQKQVESSHSLILQFLTDFLLLT